MFRYRVFARAVLSKGVSFVVYTKLEENYWASYYVHMTFMGPQITIN
jgi:hypothetical protein